MTKKIYEQRGIHDLDFSKYFSDVAQNTHVSATTKLGKLDFIKNLFQKFISKEA